MIKRPKPNGIYFIFIDGEPSFEASQNMVKQAKRKYARYPYSTLDTQTAIQAFLADRYDLPMHKVDVQFRPHRAIDALRDKLKLRP